MKLEIRQQVKPQGDGGWEWAVWIEGPADDLDEIHYVEYILHPTFSNPVRKVSNRRNKFRLKARGWGEFNLLARIHLGKDEMLVLEHWLELDEDKKQARQAEQQATSRGAQRFSEQTRLYVSSGLADMKIAYALKDALEEKGVEVVIGQEDEQPLEDLLASGRYHIQAGVFVVSEMRNPWLNRDYLAMQFKQIETLTVQVGEESELPNELKEMPHFQIRNPADTKRVASSIIQRLSEQHLDP